MKPHRLRPALHFTPASGWINDPHGITARDGGYEVFFQYVPHRTSWAPDCHWGHATGPDLLSLTEGPVAIAPGDGDDGVWTGCVVREGDDVHAFYTATSIPDFAIGRVRAAQPVDSEWNAWTKGGVVVEAPPELDLVAFRDPFIHRDGDLWRMFVGAAGRDGTAMALTYTSPDLRAWDYAGVALERHTSEHAPVWTGALWECPQIFDLDGGSVMVSSIWDADVLHYAAYALGTFADGRFTATRWDRLTWGDSLYAPSFFTDADGHPALTFWMRGVEGDGWAGAHSIPYRLSIEVDHLVAHPHPDVTAHRTRPLPDGLVPGLAADIEWVAADGTLTVRSGGQVAAALVVADGEASVTTAAGTVSFPVHQAIRVILDGPVLEVSSSAGIFAAAVEPVGADLQVLASEGALSVFGLA